VGLGDKHGATPCRFGRGDYSASAFRAVASKIR
jgi:hypothetical protein